MSDYRLPIRFIQKGSTRSGSTWTEMRGKSLRSSSGLVNHDTEMTVSILISSRLWCVRRRVTILFVATPERVWLRVKPVRSPLIRVFVSMLGLLQTYLRQMLDSAHL